MQKRSVLEKKDYEFNQFENLESAPRQLCNQFDRGGIPTFHGLTVSCSSH